MFLKPVPIEKWILVGEMDDGTFVEGEHHITESNKNIKKIERPLRVARLEMFMLSLEDYFFTQRT